MNPAQSKRHAVFNKIRNVEVIEAQFQPDNDPELVTYYRLALEVDLGGVTEQLTLRCDRKTAQLLRMADNVNKQQTLLDE